MTEIARKAGELKDIANQMEERMTVFKLTEED